MAVKSIERLPASRCRTLNCPQATALIRGAENDLLFDHSRRCSCSGAEQGRRRGCNQTWSLLYVGAMFHDLGLTERYRTSDNRFEVDSASRRTRVPAATWGRKGRLDKAVVDTALTPPRGSPNS